MTDDAESASTGIQYDTEPRLLAIDSRDSDSLADADLMRRLAAGEMSALTQIVNRHQQRIRSLAYRFTGRWDVADDIAQEAFLRVYRFANRYKPTAAFSTWLYRIVTNLCLDSRKARRPVQLIETTPASDDGSDQPLIDQEKLAAVQREVQALPERQRIAVLLHRFEGLSHEQIATATGWGSGAVESLLVRAYEQLRQRLRMWRDG